MPLYECECAKCGVRSDYYQPVADRHSSPRCACGGKTKMVFSAPFVQDDIPPYVSPTTGRVIGSRTKRRDDLRRSNCREWEGMAQERAEAARRERYDEQRRDQKLEHAARDAYHQRLTPAQRRLVEGR
jgi:putative FmdB family regulatory protein